MEATLKKQRHQGALIITGPLASPPLTYLSALSGCRVTRTKDAKFAPQRTIQEKNAFIKSMLQQYANVESFQWWCSVLHEFVKKEPLLRLKLHLSVYLDCDLREIPKKNPCAELIRDYACKLFDGWFLKCSCQSSGKSLSTEHSSPTSKAWSSKRPLIFCGDS